MAEDVFDSSSESEPNDSSASSSGDQGSNEPAGKGRTLDQLQKESQRKFKDMEDKMGLLVDGMTALTDAANRQAQSPQQAVTPARQDATPQVSNYGAPSDLSQHSVGDLQQALANPSYTAHQRQILQAAINDKQLKEQVDSQFAIRDKQGQIDKARKDSDEAASIAFPALDNPKSDFARRVEAALKTERSQFGEHPRDRYNVANQIAREMGVEIARVVTPGFRAPADSGAPDPQNEGPEMPSREQMAINAGNLKYAMPLRRNPETGKLERVKFNLDRLKARTKAYAQDKPFYGVKGVTGRGN